MSDGYETEELTRIEAALDALVSPTSEDVFQATRPFDERAIASVAATRGGGGFPAAWAVDDATGRFFLNYDYSDSTLPALRIDHVGEPTDYTPMFLIGDNDPTLTGTMVFSIDSSGDSDWVFRDSGVSLIFHRVHDGDTRELVTIGESQFAVGPGTLVVYYDDNYLQLGSAGSTISFFAAAGAAKQTGVAVTADAIHAALVAYGLIAA